MLHKTIHYQYHTSLLSSRLAYTSYSMYLPESQKLIFFPSTLWDHEIAVEHVQELLSQVGDNPLREVHLSGCICRHEWIVLLLDFLETRRLECVDVRRCIFDSLECQEGFLDAIAGLGGQDQNANRDLLVERVEWHYTELPTTKMAHVVAFGLCHTWKSFHTSFRGPRMARQLGDAWKMAAASTKAVSVLCQLNLDGSSFRNDQAWRDFCSFLSKHKSLISLSLKGCALTPSQIESLATALQQSCLEQLDIVSNALHYDAYSDILTNCSRLISVDLSHPIAFFPQETQSNLREFAWKSFCRAMQDSRSLKAIRMAGHDLGDMHCPDLGYALCNLNITSLDLSQNRISAHGIAALSQALKSHESIRSLNLRQNAYHSYEDLNPLIQLVLSTTCPHRLETLMLDHVAGDPAWSQRVQAALVEQRAGSRYLKQHSTEVDSNHLPLLLEQVQANCRRHNIPVEGVLYQLIGPFVAGFATR